LATLLGEQRRFRDVLLAIGAKRSKGWAEVFKALKEPPFDEASGPDLEGCRRWFVELLLRNPERPPPGRPVKKLLKEADALFRVAAEVPDAAMTLRRRKRGTGTGRRLVVPGRVSPKNILALGRGRKTWGHTYNVSV
jgi:hypothetical protein